MELEGFTRQGDSMLDEPGGGGGGGGDRNLRLRRGLRQAAPPPAGSPAADRARFYCESWTASFAFRLLQLVWLLLLTVAVMRHRHGHAAPSSPAAASAPSSSSSSSTSSLASLSASIEDLTSRVRIMEALLTAKSGTATPPTASAPGAPPQPPLTPPISALQRRVSAVEASIVTVQKSVTTITSSVGSVQTRMSSIDARNSEVDAALRDLRVSPSAAPPTRPTLLNGLPVFDVAKAVVCHVSTCHAGLYGPIIQCLDDSLVWRRIYGTSTYDALAPERSDSRTSNYGNNSPPCNPSGRTTRYDMTDPFRLPDGEILITAYDNARSQASTWSDILPQTAFAPFELSSTGAPFASPLGRAKSLPTYQVEQPRYNLNAPRTFAPRLNGTWHFLEAPPVNTGTHACVWVKNENRKLRSQPENVVKCVPYDRPASAFVLPASEDVPAGGIMASVGGNLYVFGAASAQNSRTDTHKFDFASKTWSKVAPRDGVGSLLHVISVDSFIYVFTQAFKGTSNSYSGTPAQQGTQARIERFDPTSNTYTTLFRTDESSKYELCLNGAHMFVWRKQICSISKSCFTCFDPTTPATTAGGGAGEQGSSSQQPKLTWTRIHALLPEAADGKFFSFWHHPARQ